MGAQIRRATPADWLAVTALLVDLGRPEVRNNPEQEEQAREAYNQYLTRADAVALVAELDGQVVGFLDLEFRNWLNRLTPQAWIPDVIVHENSRGHGIGGLLIERAEELARSRGCWGMGLESANWRTDAHRFYESHGWKPAAKHFLKILDE